jgi:hypothetical protein
VVQLLTYMAGRTKWVWGKAGARALGHQPYVEAIAHLERRFILLRDYR